MCHVDDMEGPPGFLGFLLVAGRVEDVGDRQNPRLERER
jgi:hypothetical protein